MRAFRIHDDTPLVHLDPKAHQAGWVFLKAGFYRFLDGLDHLLFVIVLALPFRRVRDLVKPFVAFAIGHSITLTVAAFGLAQHGHVVRADGWGAHRVFAGLCVHRKWSRESFSGRPWGKTHPIPFSVSPASLGRRRSSSACSTASASRSRCRKRCSLRDRIPIAALAAYNIGLELGTLIILAIVLPAANLLFSSDLAERAGIIVASVLVGHAGWHWMTERLAIARLSSWPVMDLNLLLTVVRWLLALTVIGGAAWFVAGLMQAQARGA